MDQKQSFATPHSLTRELRRQDGELRGFQSRLLICYGTCLCVQILLLVLLLR